MSAPLTDLGPYSLLEPLGQGAMGAVYRARHRELGVTRAVKVLLRAERRSVQRFEREVSHLARVHHPNVVAIHECGAEQGRCYFAMDLVEGRTLHDLIASEGPQPWERALELLLGLCRGVDALHAEGIVHRDLKPQNVMVNLEGQAVLVDFGLAVDPDNDERLTRTGALVGTLAYMAPEQFGGGGVSARADVYALGLILFELLTGQPAIEGNDSAPEMIGQILKRERLSPGSVDPSLPARFDDVVARASARDPSQRYARAGELAAALEDLRAEPGVSRRRRRAWHFVAWTLVCGVFVGGSALFALSRARVPSGPAPPPSGSQPIRSAGEARRVASEELRALRRLEQLPELYRAALAWRRRHAEHAPKLAERLEAHVARAALAKPFRELPPTSVGRFVAGSGDPPPALLSLQGGLLQVWDLGRAERASAWELRAGWRGDLPVIVGELLRRSTATRETPPLRIDAPRWTVCGVEVPGTDEVLVAGLDGKVALLAPGRPARALPALPNRIYSVAVSPRGDVYAAANYGNLVRQGQQPAVYFCSLPEGRLIARHLLIGSGSILAFSSDGERVAVGTTMGRVCLFEREDLTRAPRALGTRSLPFRADAFVSDAPGCRGVVVGLGFARETLYAVSRGIESWRVDPGWRFGDAVGGDLRAWDAKTGRELRQEVSATPRDWLDVSADGRWLLAGQKQAPTQLYLLTPTFPD